MKQYISRSVEQTKQIAYDLAQTFVGGETLLLEGDLGAGKTHFAKGLAEGLGIADTVTSPTFTLHNVYEGGRLTFNHFDFYRVDDSEEVEMLGLCEYFSTPDGVAAIEWSANVKNLLPTKCITVNIAKLSDTERQITVTD
jgi:hydrolase, P-loop family